MPFTALLTAVLTCPASLETQPDGATLAVPNIVLILADDAGYADFGFQPDAAPDVRDVTPNIDSIARNGLRLSSFYMTGDVCSPSRAGLLTGRYQQRFGHERNLPPGYMDGGMSLAESTIADRLRELGYQTACIGKWHLGYPAPYHPNERGFDYFFGCLKGSRSYFPSADPPAHEVLQENGVPTPESGHVTDRLGQAAVAFIEKSAQETERQPFFLFLSFTAPHVPLEPKDKDLALPSIAKIEPPRRRQYVALLRGMDDNVGRVLEALRATKLERETLVVFTNDNGGSDQGAKALNTPLRGRKGTLHEGGVRVACCIQWPGQVPAGSVLGQPLSALDLLPTFVRAAGGDPATMPGLDGVDALALWTGDAAPPPARRLFWRNFGSAGPVAVRSADWKLYLADRTGALPELYDLAADPGEANDLAGAHPETVAELLGEVAAWESGLIEPLWAKDIPEWKKQ